MSGTIQWAGGGGGAQNPAALAGPTQREAQDFSGQLSGLADQMKGLAQELAPTTARNLAAGTGAASASGGGAMQGMQALGQSWTAAKAGQGASTGGPEASAPQSAPTGGETAQMIQEMLSLLQQLLQMMEGGQGASGQPTAGGTPVNSKPSGPGCPEAAGGGAPAQAGQSPGGAAPQTAPGEGAQGVGASKGSVEQEIMQMLQTMLSMMQQLASGNTQAA